MGMDEKIEKRRWTPARIIVLTAILGGAAFFLTSVYKNAGVSRLNVAEERILTDTIHKGVFKEFITIFGTVEPLKTVYLDAIESGRVEEIFVEDGTMVERDQSIMRLSNLNLQLEVMRQEEAIINRINEIRLQGILREQQSITLKERALEVAYQIDILEKRTQRNKELFRDSIISKMDYEEEQDNYENQLRRSKLLKELLEKDSLSQVFQEAQLETSLDLMRRNLEFAKSSLDNLIVKAPIKGQLSSMDSEVGELINQGSRIAQIDVLEDFKILARIDEFYISRIFVNQTGSFTMDGKTYHLRIKKIYPEVANGNFEVDLVFEGERPTNIKRGQTISLKLSLSDETEAMLLAKGGFFQSTGGNWVYVKQEDGIARKRDIKLGRQNPNYYEVQQGLEEGDIVVISSYENYGEKDELVIK